MLAIIGAGGIYTGCNPSYTANEVERHLKLTNARFLIADADLLIDVADRVIEGGLPTENIFQMANHVSHIRLFNSSRQSNLKATENHRPRESVRFVSFYVVPRYQLARTSIDQILL